MIVPFKLSLEFRTLIFTLLVCLDHPLLLLLDFALLVLSVFPEYPGSFSHELKPLVASAVLDLDVICIDLLLVLVLLQQFLTQCLVGRFERVYCFLSLFLFPEFSVSFIELVLQVRFGLEVLLVRGFVALVFLPEHVAFSGCQDIVSVPVDVTNKLKFGVLDAFASLGPFLDHHLKIHLHQLCLGY